MFFYYVFALGFIVCTVGVCGQDNTTPLPCYNNDVLEIACWGYKQCYNNIQVTFKCLPPLVMERATLSCVDPATSTSHECSQVDINICKGKSDGFYGNTANKCHTYTRCIGGVSIGEFYCPATTVFNDKDRTCDYPINVLPPCGVKPVVG
ncbi:uncharacterized protein LOC131951911 [Physella acuta]|uniref:uncharacterized protein LOC131951911 n=1 Tax=Physella acuta TaxID=109671 RepID=UPI0027DEAA53|nr:uncharacterized protein LOC131951911 [Physella acuta]